MSQTLKPPERSTEVVNSDEEGEKKGPFANFGRTFKKVAGVVARTAASAAELLRDEEMRKRGAQELAERARILQQEVRNTLNKAPKSLQGVLGNVQQRINDARLQTRLKASKDTKVDVQVGLMLYNGIPQEWRSRLWMAMLQRPSCCNGFAEISEGMRVRVRQRLVAIQRSQPSDDALQHPEAMEAPAASVASQSMSDPGSPSVQGSVQSCAPPTPARLANGITAGAPHAAGSDRTNEDTAVMPPAECSSRVPENAVASEPSGQAVAARGTDGEEDARAGVAAAAHDGASRSSPGSKGRPPTVPPVPSDAGLKVAGRTGAVRKDIPYHATVKVVLTVLPSVEEGFPPLVSVSIEGAAQLPRASHKRQLSDMTGESNRAEPCTSSAQPGLGSRQSSVRSLTASEHSTPSTSGRAAADAPPQAPTGSKGPTVGLPGTGSAGAPGAHAASHGDRTESGDLGEWEVLQRQGSLLDSQGRWLLLQAGRQKLEWAEDVEDKQEAAWLHAVALVDEVDAVEWPVSADPDHEEAYHTLLSSPLPPEQEDLDDVIGRDIHRTFPEHPQFGFEQGQQQLFRVLKAYALQDAEVGYCQGMAFMVGVLLMYLPEEPAFRVAKLLLLPPGPNLRRLYLPTMEGLKLELRKFEWLMKRFLPKLLAHLESHGIVSVLYAAQWFLTVFSCPFPPSFACRMIDIMLWERSDHIMQRTALAVMAECAGDLMELDDFEEIITFLKMQLAGWTGKRARRVLSNALWSPVTEDILQAAEQAVKSGFIGSFSRMSSRLHSTTEGVEADAPQPPEDADNLSRNNSSTSVVLHGPLASTSPEDEDQYLRMVMEMEGLWGGTPIRQASTTDTHGSGAAFGNAVHQAGAEAVQAEVTAAASR